MLQSTKNPATCIFSLTSLMRTEKYEYFILYNLSMLGLKMCTCYEDTEDNWTLPYIKRDCSLCNAII